MAIGLLGKKIGMTRVYDEKGTAVAVTVVHAAGNAVLKTNTKESDGYSSVLLGYGEQKESRVSAPELGLYKKAGTTPKRFLKEFRLAEDTEVTNEQVDLAQFAVGDWVDVIGTSKGKGFQGVMKRHNFSGQNMTHGSMMHRRPGAIGNRSTPGLVFKNMKMPGHLGDEKVTTQNLKVIQVRPEDGVILISGAIPGANGSFVVIRPAIKKQKKAA
jgi:large subunit ribosomal protein L3